MPVLRALLLACLLCFGFGTVLAQEQEQEPEPTRVLPIDPEPDLSMIWEFIEDHPEDVGLACMPLERPETLVLYNPYELYPLASVSKLLIFIEYARRIDGGTISLDEMVTLESVNRYDIPRTNGGAHTRFTDVYSGQTAISLWEVATVGMMQYSSNAAADYMLDRLAPIDWPGFYSRFSISRSGTPHSLTVIPLLLNNHDDGEATLDSIIELTPALGEQLLDKFVQDQQWRDDELEYRSELRQQFPSWEVQSAFMNSQSIQGTPYDFLNLMVSIYQPGGPLTENVKQMTRMALRWDENDAINFSYREYGSKLGFYSGGVLTLIAYGEPYVGEPVVSVVFIRNLTRDEYYDIMRADMIGHMAHWMNLHACDGLNEQLIETVGESSP